MTGRTRLLFSLITAVLFCGVAAQTVRECENVTVGDIVFLVDGSSSIVDKSFQEIRTFLRNTIQGFEIGPDKVQIGLVQYSNDPYPEFQLTDHRDKKSLLAAVESFTHRRGGTETGKAIDFLRTEYFTEKAGSRAERRVPQVAVVITDGESVDDVLEPARRLKQHGVIVFAIGVGNINQTQLITIANWPPERFVLTTVSYQELQDQTNILLGTVCLSLEDQTLALVDRFADIFYLVDSGIASNQFALFRSELMKQLNRLGVGASGYRVGLAQYGQTVRVDFRLNTYQTASQIVSAARRFKLRSQPGQPRNLGQALTYARENFFTAEAGGRAEQGTPQYLVVVAGKDSDDPAFWSAEKLKGEGVTIVAMSAGARPDALSDVASPGYIFDSPRVTVLTNLFTNLSTQTVQIVTEGCRTANKADIVFIVDESGSIGEENFRLMRDFLRSVISSLETGPSNIRVGIVTYNYEPIAHAYLNMFGNKDDILKFINILPYRRGGTKTGAALHFALKNVFTEEKGSRKDVPKVAVVITDGESQDDVKEHAIALRRAGVTVFAVGIKDANKAELLEMASYPKSKFVFTVDSFIKLKPLKETLQATLCNTIIQIGVQDKESDAETKKACEKNDQADIFFLMDDSGSIINEDFSDMQKFIIEFLHTFRIGPDHIRMGLVKYSDSPSLEFDLTQHSDAKTMEKVVKDVIHKGGGTNTGKALSFMKGHFENAKQSRGYKVSEYLIVITDGQSQDKVKIPAEELRTQDVIIYAIGVKDSNDNELNEIAGDPERTFFVDSFDALKTIKNNIVREICFPEACKDTQGDIFFLTDSSQSISEEGFQKMKDFTKSVISKSSIGQDKVHIGVMQYSNNTRLEFDLTTHYDLEGMLNTIDDMTPMKTRPRTGRAIAEVSRYFDAARGRRPGVKQWLVVMTDGKSQDGVREAARALRAEGVVIYAIGVDKANSSKLSDISGSSQRVFIDNTFDGFKERGTKLALKFCEKDCKIQKADIIFLVDGSKSINKEQFKSMLTFMASVVNQTTVGKDLTRFGVILYSDTPKTSFTLNTIYSKGKLLEALQQLVQPQADTYTGAALAYSLPFFNAEHGGRKGIRVPQILMVITDGEATDSYRLEAESDALRQNGITVISIGVKGANRNELETMAGGDTSKVFFVDNFEDLETLYKNISPVLCNTTKRACNQTDLVFLLDYSSSINPEEHTMMINFTASVVDNFSVSKESAHIGLTQFSHQPKDEFYLNTYNDKTKMLEHIRNMDYKGGDTYLGKALDRIRDNFREGGRRDVPKNLVLITDGNSADDVEDPGEALRKMGITIFAIAVGDVYYLQLLQITGTPEKIFKVDSFDSLASIEKKIIDEICGNDPSEQPKTDCTIDVAIGFDITDTSGSNNLLISNYIQHLEEIVHHITHISTVDNLCCSGVPESPVKTQIAFHLVDRDGRALYDTNFPDFSEDVLKKVLSWKLSQPTYFNSELLSFYKERFKTKSTATVKVLMIFSDGLDENVVSLQQESKLLRESGVSALLAVALGGADHTQLQKVEFGRGFGYTDQLVISMPSIGSTVFQHISTVTARECCGVMCKCWGDKGPRGLPGPRGAKGEEGERGHPGFPGEEGVSGERGPPGLPGLQGTSGCPGSRGLKGYRGLSGNKGDDGEDGLNGIDGEQGETGLGGPRADRGAPGNPGIPGTGGETGLRGQKGLRGDPGSPGVDNNRPGPKGDPGSPGRPGDPGPDGYGSERGQHGNPGRNGRRGPSGDKGSPGEKGNRGPPGIPGAAGPQGPAGNNGDPGPKGTPGFPGNQGPHGSAGEPGLPGSRGPNGQKGQPGEAGVSGAPGPPGPRGTPGLDGRDGFGPEGPKGSKGDAGFTGYPGLPGDEGAKGPKGYPGSKGNRGRGGNSGLPGEPGEPGADGYPGHKGPKGPPGDRSSSECELVNKIRDNCGESRCPAYPTELVFGLDVSDDVTPTAFERQRSALLHLLEDLSVAESSCPRGARVAVVGYGAYTKQLIRFQDHHRKTALIEAVKNIAQERTSNKRQLGAAMRFVGQNIFKRVRAGFTVRKVAVFFTNGASQDDADVLAAVMEYRALNIVPAIISLRNVPAISQAMEADDTGNSIFTVLRTPQEAAADLRRVKSCAICYDPCRRAEECAFIQDPAPPQQADVDLVMVLDSSREIQADEYAGARQLLSSVAERLAVSPQPRRADRQARVALVQRSGEADFGLQTYQNAADMKTYMSQNMRQQGGSLALGRMLDYTLTEVLLKARQPRGKRAVLTVVGAETAYGDRAKLRYVSQKAKCEGVALFVVAVGDRYNRTEVEALASAPIQQHLIRLDRLKAAEQGYAQRFIRVFLSALHKGLSVYPPPEFTRSCSHLSEPDDPLDTNSQGSADWELEINDQPRNWFQEQTGNLSVIDRKNKRKRSFSGADLTGVCFLSKDAGDCMNYTIRWFFDHKHSVCSRFWYGGCGGNENRFETQEGCERVCLSKHR